MIIVMDNDTLSLQYDQLIQLEGVEYLFQFLWSDLENIWYVNIADQNGALLAALIALVCGSDLLKRWRWDPRMPPGALVVADLGELDRDIEDPMELNGNFPLCYITSDDPDLVAARAA